MRYISSQPDQPYFLWQLQVQLYNFARLGIEQDYIILIGVRDRPSALAQYIAKHTRAQVEFIPDTRTERSYAPSIQPHLYAKFFASSPISEPLMFIDSDVIFLSAPDFSALCTDDIDYVSDTTDYIGYNYVVSKGVDQFTEMCRIVGVDPAVVRREQQNSGGAQYLLKRAGSAAFWTKVEQDGNALYQYLSRRERLWKGPGYAIQRWTSGMWALLWNLWVANRTVRVTPMMEFAWGSDSIEQLRKRTGAKFLHLAGVTKDMESTHFYKGRYVTTHPFDDTTYVERYVTDEPSNGSQIYARELVEAAKSWENR